MPVYHVALRHFSYSKSALYPKLQRRKPSDLLLKPKINESIRINVKPYVDQDERVISKQYKLRRKADVEKWLLPPKPVEQLDLKPFPDMIPQHDMPVLMDDPYKVCMKKCLICQAGIALDYKNAALLSQFISPQTGIMFSQDITGLCAPMHEKIDKCIQTAQTCGLLPYRYKLDKYLHDPQLFNPMKKVNLRNANLEQEKALEAGHVPEPDKVNEDRHVTESIFATFYDKK
ncbi:hypothetical protein GJ496_008698 [Pomphorhynchus laevis]|nr:hypothetical protein GJ496_008698 [Pomphorhynchus laevis]